MRKTIPHTDLNRMLRNWAEERDSAVLYQALAALERNPRVSRLFNKLAAAERRHCAFWEERLRSQGHAVPPFRLSLRTRLLLALARQLGVALVIPNITARELRDRDRYRAQEDAHAAGLSREERGHAAVMRTIGNHVSADREEAAADAAGNANLANNLRAAVLGANDGLVANFCLLMGVAGGGAARTMILLSGVAGLLAGACSMALGEWLSVTNSREMTLSQSDEEFLAACVATTAANEDLALIYEAKGMSEEQARSAARRSLGDDTHVIEMLAREEVSIQTAHLSISPASAAAVSFLLFTLGALIPLLPFFFLAPGPAVFGSLALSLAALFTLGLTTCLFNGRSPMFSGLRQVAVGAAAAAITYLAGRLFGAVVG